MIRELTIKNLALISRITIEFDKGFSVFTGETGAGKSILIGAIGLILGDRASSEMIRSFEQEAEIIGVLELPHISDALSKQLQEACIPCPDGELIIRRIITRSERNKILVNQVPVPLSTLRSLGNYLIDFHGQHEHQSILKPEMAAEIINSLTGVTQPWHDYSKVYESYEAACRELESFDTRMKQLSQQSEYLQYEFQELSSLNLVEHEDTKLEEEFRLLSSVTERLLCVSKIRDCIDADTDQESVIKSINHIKKLLENLSKFDASADPWIQEITAIGSTLAEFNTFCTRYVQNEIGVADPSRLEEINSRLARIQRLKKKYHATLDELIAKEKQLKTQLDALSNTSADRSLLESQKLKYYKQCIEKADHLSKARKKACATFDTAITGFMQRLGFQNGQWRTALLKTHDLTPGGAEDIAFEVSTNPGEPFMSLAKTASGGEIARLMLSIKSVLADQDKIPILIFDEIDTGIGGMIAKQVGLCLRDLSRSHQLICISHLHQIASLADHHYQVSKITESERTFTIVKKLDAEEKIDEISRLLGSDTDLSRKHAQQILDAASGSALR